MRILKKTASSAGSQQKNIISLLEGWVPPKILIGKEGDAIVSKIKSHYVVTTIMKPITLEGRLSSLSIHYKECMSTLWNISTNGAEGNPFAEKPRRD